jgi:ribosomal protein L40E
MHIPRYWRAQSERYSLTGEICKQCGARLFPPRDVCPECRELALEPFAFDLDEKIYPLFPQALVLRQPNAKQVSLLQKVPITSS